MLPENTRELVFCTSRVNLLLTSQVDTLTSSSFTDAIKESLSLPVYAIFANKMKLSICEAFITSLIYGNKKRGPNVDPCGNPAAKLA